LYFYLGSCKKETGWSVFFASINLVQSITTGMKNKIGFNLGFAIIALPIGIALFRDFDFASFTFKRPVLNTLYLVTFLFLIYFMLKKDSSKDATKN